MTKSHVGMSCQVCPICGKQHSHAVLMHKQLKEVFESNDAIVEGYSLCDEHQKQFEDGYVFLIAIDPEQSTIVDDRVSDLEDAVPTGAVITVKKEWFKSRVNAELGDSPIIFIEPGLAEHLAGLAEQQSKADTKELLQ